MKPNIQEGWFGYGSPVDRTMIFYEEEPTAGALKDKVILITHYPEHVTPEFVKNKLMYDYGNNALIKEVKRLTQDLEIERKNHEMDIKDLKYLHDVFQKYIAGRSDLGAFIWGKSAVKVAAIMLEKIFKFQPFTGEFPYMVKCTCGKSFFLEHLHHIFENENKDGGDASIGKDTSGLAIKSMQSEYKCKFIDVECSCGMVTNVIPILFPFEGKCGNCNTPFTITREIYDEYKGKTFKNYVPTKIDLQNDFPNGIELNCDCGKSVTIYPNELPFEFKCPWCDAQGKLTDYQYCRLIDIMRKKQFPLIPSGATKVSVFAIKDSKTSPTGKEAFIGFTIENGNFCFVQVPYEEHLNFKVVTEDDPKSIQVRCLTCNYIQPVELDRIPCEYKCVNCGQKNTIKQFLNHHS